MTTPLPFQTLFHADWSTAAPKRSVAIATRVSTGEWQVAAPHPVGDTYAFVDRLFLEPGPVLAGFDFPIGVPTSFGQMTGLKDFPAALEIFGQGEWAQFYVVAETPDQISITRPFYPRASKAGSSRQSLVQGLAVTNFETLLRNCERGTATRGAACSLFWTLGGNQVGKAAISGWQEVIVPARRRGAHLWPFDGNLAELAKAGRPVIAETYPAEAYGHTGIAFRSGMSKRRQEDRRAALTGVSQWARRHGVIFSAELTSLIEEGFGARKSGEDPFDAFTGLLGMIEVVDGRRPEGAEQHNRDAWEGWILGQSPNSLRLFGA